MRTLQSVERNLCGAQFVNVETGFGTAAYNFGRRVLMVYQEFEAGVVILARLEAQMRLREKVGNISLRQ